ncbi:MAG: nitronate monooxygenase [Deltaproteobacteria bacterium]|nr:nitronate monooxygenase [Deltaproteobacteria bacterium]
MKTRITESFGIKHPIMLAGMNWLTTPELVAAVSNAGGLGNLAISAHTPENLKSDIKKIRELTDKPFAINQILISPTAKANMAVVIEEQVPIVNYTLGRPNDIAPIIEAVHQYGGKVLATVALARHAIRAAQLGADAVNITGHEAASHGGFATTLILIPLVADGVHVPILAAGGFHDGRGLAAALMLGADGVTMGTRFAMTHECAMHQNWKDVIVQASEQDTIYIDVGDPAVNSRVFKTKKIEEAMTKRFSLADTVSSALDAKEKMNVSWWKMITSGLKTAKGEDGMSIISQMKYASQTSNVDRVMFSGDTENGRMPIGQVIGGIKEVLTCQEVVERTVAQAEETLKAKYGVLA